MNEASELAAKIVREWESSEIVAVWCWKCRGVRNANPVFMRLRCRTCGTCHEYDQRFDEDYDNQLEAEDG